MKKFKNLSIVESIEDVNVTKWHEIQINKHDALTQMCLFSFLEGEEPSNIDLTFQEQKKKIILRICEPELQAKKIRTQIEFEQKVLFPQDTISDQIELLKRQLQLHLKINTFETYLDESAINELKQIQEIHDTTPEPSPITSWKNFEKSCFLFSKANESTSINELKNMSLYHFLSFKENVTEYMEDMKKAYNKNNSHG